MLSRDLTSENYWNEGQDTYIPKLMDDSYVRNITFNQAYWWEADVDTRMVAGDQSVWNTVYGNLPAFRRKEYYFNRMLRVKNMISGYQRRNRKSTVATPIQHDDDKAASQWTKLLFNEMNRANTDDFVSEAFEKGSIITGMSLLNIWLDYTKDPESGDIRIDHVPYSAFMIDSYFKKKDLSDCNFIWRRQWLSKSAIKAIAPEGLEDYIDSLHPRGNRDGKFQFMAESMNYSMDHLLTYDEYWYRDMRDAMFLVDTKWGMTQEWTGSKERMVQYLSAFPSLIVKKTKVPTVKLAIMVEGKILRDGPNPLRIDNYPFVPFLGYYEPNLSNYSQRVQGVMRGLRDAQMLYNRRKVIELDIMESQVNSGFIYKPTSMVNPRDIFLEGQGKGIAIKQEADINDIQKIQPAQIPASMMELSQMLGQEIQEISGVNEELLGSATDDKAGVLSMLRQGAGLTTLQVLFDNLDFSCKQLGQRFVEIIRKNYTYGKVARILGEEPVEEFDTKLWLDYDIRIEEGINTTTQRQMQFAQLLQLRELGVPIPNKTIISAATLQDKDELIKDMEQEQQQQSQMQQMQMQTQIQLLQAQIEEIKASVVEKQGLGLERLSRVQENRALAIRQIAESHEQSALADLNRAKALKEIEGVDIKHLDQLMKIVHAIKSFSEEKDDQAAEVSQAADAGPGIPGGGSAP
jgi:hypothetical protein